MINVVVERFDLGDGEFVCLYEDSLYEGTPLCISESPYKTTPVLSAVTSTESGYCVWGDGAMPLTDGLESAEEALSVAAERALTELKRVRFQREQKNKKEKRLEKPRAALRAVALKRATLKE